MHVKVKKHRRTRYGLHIQSCKTSHVKLIRFSSSVLDFLWGYRRHSGTQVRGSKPGRSRQIFSGEKILSTPSFGGEVKPSVPCRKFTACKRTQKWRGSRHFRQNSRQFLTHSSTFRCCGSFASFQTWGTPGGGSWKVLITEPPSWGFDVPLATALCKNLPAENTQRL